MIVSVPVRVPVAVGANVTDTAQLDPPATLAPQVFVSAKSPDAAMDVIDNADTPGLLIVTVWGALVVPVFCGAKFRLVGERVASGDAVPVPVSVTV